MAYAQGYRTDEDTIDPALEQAAVAAAAGADVAVIFAGLPERYESEATTAPPLPCRKIRIT